jgi:MFS family permease
MQRLRKWREVGVLAGVLFVLNAVSRLIAWIFAGDNDKSQTRIGLIYAVAVALVMVYAGYRWARLKLMPRVVGELSAAVLLGLIFSLILGPFAGGSAPFVSSGDLLWSEAWHYLLLAGIGATLGVLIAIMLGRDPRSQAYKRYAEANKGKPRRVARR